MYQSVNRCQSKKQCRYRRYLGCFQVYVFFLSQKIIPINIVRICSTSPVLEDLTKTTSHHCHQEITTPTVLALLPHRFPSSSYFHIIYIYFIFQQLSSPKSYIFTTQYPQTPGQYSQQSCFPFKKNHPWSLQPKHKGLVGGMAASSSSQMGQPKSLPKTRPRKFRPTQRLCPVVSCETSISHWAGVKENYRKLQETIT